MAKKLKIKGTKCLNLDSFFRFAHDACLGDLRINWRGIEIDHIIYFVVFMFSATHINIIIIPSINTGPYVKLTVVVSPFFPSAISRQKYSRGLEAS